MTSNRNNDQDLVEDLFSGTGMIPKMGRRTKTAAERQSDDSHKNKFFGMMWFCLASTTFIFGFRNLPEIFVDMLSWTPFTPQTVATVAAWGGGFMGLIFLDLAYPYWGRLAMRNSDTPDQYSLARWAQDVAFYGSVYFTAAVILTLFPQIPDGVIWFLGVVGAVVFVLATVNSMVCMYYFQKWSADSIKMAQDTKSESDMNQEILEMYAEVQTQATALTREFLQEKIPELSKHMAEQMAANVFDEMQSKAGGEKGKG